jgi:enoyl-[acyl-carrier-protein] reductase (NADH)
LATSAEDRVATCEMSPYSFSAVASACGDVIKIMASGVSRMAIIFADRSKFDFIFFN